MLKVDFKDEKAIKSLEYGKEYEIAMGKGKFIGYNKGEPVLLYSDNPLWATGLATRGEDSTLFSTWNPRTKEQRIYETLSKLFEKLESEQGREAA